MYKRQDIYGVEKLDVINSLHDNVLTFVIFPFVILHTPSLKDEAVKVFVVKLFVVIEFAVILPSSIVVIPSLNSKVAFIDLEKNESPDIYYMIIN